MPGSRITALPPAMVPAAAAPGRPIRRSRALLAAWLAGAAAFTAVPAAAQSVLDRPPNLTGAWVPAPGMVQFNFIHRFGHSGAPARKVTASPTFLLGVGLPADLMLAANYATNSVVARGYPNEWEFFARARPLAEEAGRPLDLAVQVAYNAASDSYDGELAVARRLGLARLSAAARRLGPGRDGADARTALAGGAVVRLGDRGLAVAGDAATLTGGGDDDDRVAWSAGLHMEIPFTPHSLSLHVANTNTGTLRGASTGLDRVRFGFEFTVPITPRRYLGRPAPAAPAAAFAGDDEVVVSMRDIAFVPARLEVEAGTTIAWRNDDPVVHTVTARDGSWDSGDIAPGQTWRRTFDSPGEYAIICTPHPFMTAVVVVR